MDFAAANPALLDLMYSVKYDPAAAGRLPELAAQLIEDGQLRGEVREGPVEGSACPSWPRWTATSPSPSQGGFPPTVSSGG